MTARIYLARRAASGALVQLTTVRLTTVRRIFQDRHRPLGDAGLPGGVSMFFTYLRRELRRRIRQASFIALGLALGIGLVITVIAASSGVKDAQATVLHSLYGVGTDVTVTQTPTAGSGGPTGFGFRGRVGNGTRPASGTKIDIDNLTSIGQGTLSASSVTSIGKLHNVAGSAGALSLTDAVITGKIPAINTSGGGGTGSGGGFGGGGGGGFFRGNFKSNSFTVSGVDLGTGALGPLSSAKLKSGRTFASTDATSDVAVINSDYATQKKLSVGSAITVAKTSFKVVGIASAGANASDVFIPLARAQALASLKGKVNTIYVAADSASNISGVAKEISVMLPKATVTTSNSLASEVTGSLSSAASLANNLGKWLAIAVLVAAFLLASLLTMAAVTRRVREFGTLKALGWRSRRIIGQVMGESIAIGLVGGVIGVALGFAGAALVTKLTSPLTASPGQTTGSATPGGARTFGGGFGGGGGAAGGGGGFGGARPGGFFGRAAADAHGVAVHLSAPVTIGAVVLAVLLALAGGLIAGCFGGWRAARLRPAAALSRVE
jgi:putative ABC transport system permease protein